MQLLVSVVSAAEARTALLGGADVIDAKDPRRGALGAVTLRALHSIHAAVHPHRPVSAALGDAADRAAIERRAGAAAAAGVSYIKVGFRAIASPARVLALATAALHGVRAIGRATRVVLVAYADAARAGSLDPTALLETAARCSVDGVLLDTAYKDADALFELLAPDVVGAWVDAAHAAGLTAGLAGGLVARDLATASDLGADIVGVRGAACDGGRTGHVSRSRVTALSALLGTAARPALV